MKSPDVATQADTQKAKIDDLVARGVLSAGSDEPLPEDFFTRRRPRAKRSVLDALEEDRNDER